MLVKALKLTTKGILLCTTILVIMFFIMGIDSIYDNSITLEWVLTIIVLLILCTRFISKQDLLKLTLNDK